SAQEPEPGDVQRQRHWREIGPPSGLAAARAPRRGRTAGTQGARRGIPRSRTRAGRLRRALAGAALLERRCAAGTRRGPAGKPPRPAGRTRRPPEPLPGSGGARHRGRGAVPAQRQSPAGAEVRLQAALDGAAGAACGRPGGPAASGGADGRLQRHSHRCRRLRPQGLASRRPDPARGARGLRQAAGAGLDRRPGAAFRRRSRAIHLLGLFPPARRARPRPAHRPPPAQSRLGAAPGRCRRGPPCAAAGEGQRPCANLGADQGAAGSFPQPLTTRRPIRPPSAGPAGRVGVGRGRNKRAAVLPSGSANTADAAARRSLPSGGIMPNPPCVRRVRRFRLSFTFSLCLFAALALLAGAAQAQPSGGPYGPIPQSYAVPGTGSVYYVAPDGVAANPGTTLAQPTTIESTIARVVTGDSLVRRGGPYRTGGLQLNQGITLPPYLDERPVLKGTRVASGWQELRDNVWRTKWDRLFPATPLAWWRLEREGMRTPLHRFNNDMVFVDGRPLLSQGWAG